MDTPTVRLLPFLTADGPTQMAADEALLESAEAGIASLRFYGWSAPTISLGYFQPADCHLADPLLAGLPWVRRHSGGSALLHDREVTYALALPAGPPWHKAGDSWLCRMHGIIRDALASRGATSPRACACAEARKLGEVLCFLHHTAGDLIVGESKVVGSAQRRHRGAVLQHGGILLARSPHTPALPGLKELTGQDLPAADVADAVATTFARQTGWAVVPGSWSSDEWKRVGELAAQKYASPAWNHKR
jgi:lipoate-protein ligase A